MGATPGGMTRERSAEGPRATGGRGCAAILREHVLTPVNLVTGCLAAVALLAGGPADAVFALTAVAATLVAVTAELRAWRLLDRLSPAPRPAVVVRDTARIPIPSAEVAVGDLLALDAGDEVPADGEVADADGLEVDESPLTGDPVPRAAGRGETLLAGSLVVSGSGTLAVTATGGDTYASTLSAEGADARTGRWELRDATARLLLAVLALAVPAALAAAARALAGGVSPLEAASASARIVATAVPLGFVLLTGLALAVTALRLERSGAIVRRLAAIDVLARVDAVCVGKTGTLTEAALDAEGIEPLADDADGAAAAIGALAALGDDPAARALALRFPAPGGWPAPERRAGATHWSAADFGERGCWVLGPPEALVPDGEAPARGRAASAVLAGRRVLLLGRCDGVDTPDRIPDYVTPVAVVTLGESARPGAAEALARLGDGGGLVRVLSGDAPARVASVAYRLGLDAEDPVNAHDLTADDAGLERLVRTRTVFARISPAGKARVVRALRRTGRTVALAGGGLADVPAMAAADVAIAVGTGGPARSADIVLPDGALPALPLASAEGKRVLANLERAAKLFVTRSVYTALLALSAAVLGRPAPVLARQSALVGVLTVVVPAAFLAFASEPPPYRPGLAGRTLRFALPAGVAAALAADSAFLGARRLAGVSPAEAHTAATLALALVGLWTLSTLAQPPVGWRVWLVQAMALSLGFAVVVPLTREVFALAVLPPAALAVAAAAAAGGAVLVRLGLRIAETPAPQ